MSNREYRARTVHAAGWALLARVSSQSISIIVGVVLARLLLPEDFGIIAMVLPFTAVAALLVDVGLGSALIQRKDIQEDHFASVFWLNLILGMLLAFALYTSSGFISSFYQNPLVQPVTALLCLPFIFSAISLVPRVRLTKLLFFKRLATCDFVAMAVSGFLAVLLAAQGFGYWSLAVQILCQQFVSAGLVWLVGGWRPRGGISFKAMGQLFGFGANVFCTTLLQHASNNLDKLLVGRFLAAQALGYLDKAQSMVLFPLQNVSHAIGSVMFPALSLIQSELPRVREVYLRAIRAVALLTFPMFTGMFVVAEPFVHCVLGQNWTAVVPILRILCGAGIVNSVTTLTGSIYLSQGASALQFRVNMITQPFAVICLIAGLQWGIVGVALGYVAASIASSVVTLTVACGLIDLRLTTLVRYLCPIFLASLSMGAVISGLSAFSGIQVSFWLLPIQIAIGIVSYWILITIFRLEAYQDLKCLIGNMSLPHRSKVHSIGREPI